MSLIQQFYSVLLGISLASTTRTR